MKKNKTNDIKLLGTLVNADESGIIANASQVYDSKANKSVEERVTNLEDKQSEDNASRVSDLNEVNKHLDNLDTKDTNLQESIENITKTGEASAASNVTYNHDDSQLDASNVQQAIDEVYKKSNINDGDEVIDANTIHLIEDNPEYVYALVDSEDRLLVGIKKDTGSPYYGVEVPTQVRDYIDGKINELLGTDDATSAIDSLKEIEAFLAGFSNSDTLKALLDNKADKTALTTAQNTLQTNIDLKADKKDLTSVQGALQDTIEDYYKKSNPAYNEETVDTNSLSEIIDNDDFVDIKTDNDGKILESTDVTGKKTFYDDVEIKGNLINQNDENRIDALDENIENVYKKSNPTDEDGNIVDTNSLERVEDSTEYLKAITDHNNKLLIGIKTDGDIEYGVGVPTQIKEYVNDKINNIKSVAETVEQYDNELQSTKNSLANVINRVATLERTSNLTYAQIGDSITYLADNKKEFSYNSDNNGDKELTIDATNGYATLGLVKHTTITAATANNLQEVRDANGNVVWDLDTGGTYTIIEGGYYEFYPVDSTQTSVSVKIRGGSYTSEGYKGWGYGRYVCNKYGITYANHYPIGLNGSTFVSYMNMWNAGYCDFPENVDIYSILLGTNDWAGNEELGTTDDYVNNTFPTSVTCYGAIRAMIEKIYSLSTNKSHRPTIVFLLPMLRGAYGYGSTEEKAKSTFRSSSIIKNTETNKWEYVKNSNGYTIEDYRDAIKWVCEYESLNYIDLKNCIGTPHTLNTASTFDDSGWSNGSMPTQSDYTYDNLHPTAKGFKNIAARVIHEFDKFVFDNIKQQ